MNPLNHTLAFWRPLDRLRDIEALAEYREHAGPPSRGIQVVPGRGEERAYRVTGGGAEFRIFGAVSPLEPDDPRAEVVAEISDDFGQRRSCVLWYPHERCVILPFDPAACIDAFRFERYMPAARKTVLPAPLLAAYYALKPLIPAWARRALRGVIAHRAGSSEHFLSWPADCSQDELQKFLLRLVMMALGERELRFVWFWPKGHPWAAILTHDVETAGGLAHIGNIMEAEDSRGMRSSFNLVPHDYEIPGSVLAAARGAGFEIGVHGYRHDGLMFAEWPTFLERAVAINECARRWHASGFRSPATYRNLEWMHMLDVEYDSSVTDTAPYEPQPGGCASLFPYVVEPLVELPMTLAQDHTLFSLLNHADASAWLDKLGLIRDSHAMACVLTHPDPAAGYIGCPEVMSHYNEVLDFIAASDAWTPLPRDMARWWRARAGGSGASADDCAASGGLPDDGAVGTARLDADGILTIVPPGRE